MLVEFFHNFIFCGITENTGKTQYEILCKSRGVKKCKIGEHQSGYFVLGLGRWVELSFNKIIKYHNINDNLVFFSVGVCGSAVCAV